MTYTETVNDLRKSIVHTATALNDGSAAVTVALVGFLSAIPEGLALYLTASAIIGPAFAFMLSVSLPAVSVGCVYVAVTKKSKGMWGIFFGQLCLSIALTSLLGGSWEVLLPVATGFGAIVASIGQAHHTETKSANDDKNWERQQDALDREAKREAIRIDAEAKAAVKVAKAGQTTPDMAGQLSKKQRAYNMTDEGLSPREIAEELDVTARTVRRYLSERMSENVTPVVHMNGTTNGVVS